MFSSLLINTCEYYRITLSMECPIPFSHWRRKPDVSGKGAIDIHQKHGGLIWKSEWNHITAYNMYILNCISWHIWINNFPFLQRSGGRVIFIHQFHLFPWWEYLNYLIWDLLRTPPRGRPTLCVKRHEMTVVVNWLRKRDSTTQSFWTWPRCHRCAELLLDPVCCKQTVLY